MPAFRLPLLVRRTLLTGAALAGALAAHNVVDAPAAPIPVVPQSSGLTEPGALVRTPDGALWSTFPEIGVCRISDGVDPRPVTTAYCGDEDHQGPKEALGMAFDAASSSFYVADGGSNTGGVWRMHWNAATGAIDSAVQITLLGDDRATGLALAPTGPVGPSGKRANEVYLTTKRATAVLRIANPQGAAATPVTAGFARAAGSTSLAVLDDDLYIAEQIEVEEDDLGGAPPPADVNGVSRLRLGGPNAPQAVPVPGLDGGRSNAVATDPARGRVYMGTATGMLVDHVDVLDVDSGHIETYETGFTHITALAIEADGDILVGDDPGAGMLAIDSAGMGRIFRVGLQTLDRPSPSITSAPRVVANATQASFAYASRAGALFECRLDGATWASCPGAGTGAVRYEGLAEGVHSFDVRAVDAAAGSTPGNALRRTFIVDLTSPTVTIDRPTAATHVEGRPLRVDFSADENGVAFTCAVDDRAPEPCSPGWTVENLPVGTHELRIEGTDQAGNASSPADPAALRRITVVPAPPAPPAPTAPAPTAPAAAQAPQPAAPASRETATVIAGSAPRSGARVAAAAATLPRRGRRLALRVSFDAPPDSRWARLTLRDFEESPDVQVHAQEFVRVTPDSTARVTWTLTRSEARRLRAGRYRLTVSLGPSGSRLQHERTGMLRIRPRG